MPINRHLTRIGITLSNVEPVPGWNAKITTTHLTNPVKMTNDTVTDAVASIVWTANPGNAVATGQFQQFRIPTAGLPTNTTQLMFTATQTYTDGAVVNWNQPTPPGGPEPDHPAPHLTLTTATTAGPASSGGVSATTPPTASPMTMTSTDNTARWLGGIAVALAAAALASGLIRGRRPTGSSGPDHSGGPARPAHSPTPDPGQAAKADIGMKRLLIGAILACVAVLGLATPAFAHDVLVSSNPTNGARLTTGPTTVELSFNAPVQNGPNVITVIGPDRNHWEKTTNATVNGDTASTSVAPLGPAGVYTIGYRVISADGHPSQGQVQFTLTTAGTGTPITTTNTGPAADTGTGGSGGLPIWMWTVALLVPIGVGVFAVLQMSRRTNNAQG
jgi:methionine-rich copper-binding protein CopC